MPAPNKLQQQIKAKSPADYKAIMDKTINWKKLIKRAYKLALGGEVVENGNGMKYTSQPNMEAIKFLMEHRFGKPETRITENADNREVMKKMSEFIDAIMLPKSSKTYTPNTSEVVNIAIASSEASYNN